MPRKKSSASDPWVIPDPTKSVATAIRNFTNTSPEAMKYIIEVACNTYNLSFSPESDRFTNIAEGKRAVGLQLVRILNSNMNNFKGEENG